MKKIVTILAASLLILCVSAMGAPAEPIAPSRACANFVDADNDGVCDVCRGADINNDGICDACPFGATPPRGARFVDADNDGVCDNRVNGCGRGRNNAGARRGGMRQK